MTGLSNTRVVFARRPQGPPDASCWEIVRDEPVRDPGPGQVLVEVVALSIDPAMRAWMDEDEQELNAVPGRTMVALGVGRVVQSEHPGLAPGDAVFGALGVQRYALRAGDLLRRLDEQAAPLHAWLGVLGPSAGISAWVGMVCVGEPGPEECVVVSAAAGAVGSLAGQIAKIAGARVVGIAGGPAKVRYVVDELGFDACIDYKREDVRARLAELAPDGIDLFFDNVGGEILDAGLDRLATGARVVLCGAISQYHQRGDVRGPKLYLRIAERNARMLGFTVDHYTSRHPEAEVQLAGWLRAGRIRLREHVEKGLENYPATLMKLFDGSHVGKLLLRP